MATESGSFSWDNLREIAELLRKEKKRIETEYHEVNIKQIELEYDENRLKSTLESQQQKMKEMEENGNKIQDETKKLEIESKEKQTEIGLIKIN